MTSLTLLPPSELDTAMDQGNLAVEDLSQEDFAFIAYYAKYVRRDIQNAITARLRTTDIQKILESYPDDVRRKIFENLGALQLTYGCNVGCDFCGIDAIPGARKHIPFETIEWMIQEYGSQIRKNNSCFYYASEGPDYKAVRKDGSSIDYEDVLELCTKHLDWHPFTRTTAKKRHHTVLRKMIQNNHSFLISVTTDAESASVPDDIWLSKLHVGVNRNIKTVPLGTSAVEQGQIAADGIGCFDGTLITPAGVYSVIQCHNIEQWQCAPQRQFVIPFLPREAQPNVLQSDVRTIIGSEIPVYNQMYQGMALQSTAYESSHDYAFGIRPSGDEMKILSAKNSSVTRVYNPSELQDFSRLFRQHRRIVYDRHDRSEIRKLEPVYGMVRGARLLSIKERVQTEKIEAVISGSIANYMTNPHLDIQSASNIHRKILDEPTWTFEYIKQWNQNNPGTSIDWMPMCIRVNRTSEPQTHGSS